MTRLRLPAGWLLALWMLAGLTASTASAFASGHCCPEAAEASREAPCQSLTPSSCCEPNVAAQPPSLPGAPALPHWAGPPAPLDASTPLRAAGTPAREGALAALATVVLRL